MELVGSGTTWWDIVDQLSMTFAALADPTRRAIVARLALKEMSVGELAVPFKIGTRAVSKHVAVLEKAGLVTRRRDAQRRPSNLQLQPLRAIDEWLQEYRRMWDARLDVAGKVLDSEEGTMGND